MCIEYNKQNFDLDKIMDTAINSLTPVEVVSEYGRAVVISEEEWDYMRSLSVKFALREVRKGIDVHECSLDEMLAERLGELGGAEAADTDSD